MALPLLNDTPKYTLTVPSTGKKLKYRPYLVKEEKILLMANESNDKEAILEAVVETIKACTDNKVSLKDLTTFDLEYIFLKLRAKSVGEKVTLYLPCEECKHRNEVLVNLDDVQCPVVKTDPMIQVNDTVWVEMRYPNYDLIENSDDAEEVGYNIVSSCIRAVIADDEKFLIDEEEPESLRAFLDSMTREQFGKITEFVRNMPQVEYNINYDCEGCNHHNEIEIKGMQNFF